MFHYSLIYNLLLTDSEYSVTISGLQEQLELQNKRIKLLEDDSQRKQNTINRLNKHITSFEDKCNVCGHLSRLRDAKDDQFNGNLTRNSEQSRKLLPKPVTRIKKLKRKTLGKV